MMMDANWTKEDYAQAALSGAACEDHRPPEIPTWEDVEEVIEAGGDYPGGWDGWDDSDSWATLRLKDGRYAYVWEASDSTGHGCRCNGGIIFGDTAEELSRTGE